MSLHGDTFPNNKGYYTEVHNSNVNFAEHYTEAYNSNSPTLTGVQNKCVNGTAINNGNFTPMIFSMGYSTYGHGSKSRGTYGR